jgi:hypothetical protein
MLNSVSLRQHKTNMCLHQFSWHTAGGVRVPWGAAG